MTDNKAIDAEKYQGPGRLTAAVGDAKIFGFVGSIAGAIAGAGAGYFVKPESKIGNVLGRAAGLSATGYKTTLFNFKSLAVTGGAAVGATLLGVMGALYGIFQGWRNGDRGMKQFEALKIERDSARQQADSLQRQVNALQIEVASHRKRYTDDIKPREAHSSHVSAHEASKASNVDAAPAR